MKENICDNLLRRSFENHLLTYRHNRREDEILKEKFSLYQREIQLVNHHIHMTERRFEQHAQNDLGLTISYRHKPLEPSKNHTFHYSTTNKNWTTKVYSVEPLHDIVQHKSLYVHAFERRSRQYIDGLKEKTRLQKLRKERFLDETESFRRDDPQRNNDWSLSEDTRVRLPAIQQSKSNRLTKKHFPVDI